MSQRHARGGSREVRHGEAASIHSHSHSRNASDQTVSGSDYSRPSVQYGAPAFAHPAGPAHLDHGAPPSPRNSPRQRIYPGNMLAVVAPGTPLHHDFSSGMQHQHITGPWAAAEFAHAQQGHREPQYNMMAPPSSSSHMIAPGPMASYQYPAADMPQNFYHGLPGPLHMPPGPPMSRSMAPPMVSPTTPGDVPSTRTWPWSEASSSSSEASMRNTPSYESPMMPPSVPMHHYPSAAMVAPSTSPQESFHVQQNRMRSISASPYQTYGQYSVAPPMQASYSTQSLYRDIGDSSGGSPVSAVSAPPALRGRSMSSNMWQHPGPHESQVTATEIALMPPYMPRAVGSSGAGSTRRTKFKRSRTGCIMCRKRKVKCSQDGTPCKQCRIGDRVCVYEAAPPPRKRTSKSRSGDETDLQASTSASGSTSASASTSGSGTLGGQEDGSGAQRMQGSHASFATNPNDSTDQLSVNTSVRRRDAMWSASSASSSSRSPLPMDMSASQSMHAAGLPGAFFDARREQRGDLPSDTPRAFAHRADFADAVRDGQYGGPMFAQPAPGQQEDQLYAADMSQHQHPQLQGRYSDYNQGGQQ